MADKDYPTSIRLPDDLKRELASAARAQGTTLSWIIVAILKQWSVFHKSGGKVVRKSK